MILHGQYINQIYYFTTTGICPGLTTLMQPPQLHISLQLLLSVGLLPVKTVTEPGSQGVVVMGIQGIGVSTPNAAAVADATVGLANDVHMPKGNIFLKGIWSIIVATGIV